MIIVKTNVGDSFENDLFFVVFSIVISIKVNKLVLTYKLT